MKNKIIPICIFAGIIIVTLSVGFYLGLFLAKKVRIAKQQKQEQIVEQKKNIIEENDKQASETNLKTIIPKATLYWSNAFTDADGTTYFVRRDMGKAGCEITSDSKKIPDFCKSGPDLDLSECGSERNPSMATICELVAWKADGTQDFIADLLKIAPSQYNDLTVDLLGFSESGTILLRYGNPWPHSSWFGIFTYDISNRLISKKPLVVWSGGYYNEWSVLEKDDYKLIFHPWVYDETKTRFSKEGINDIGIYLIDHGEVTKVDFPNYSFSQNPPNVEMVVADNWKPSSSVSFCFGKEKWSFNFETKSFLNLKEKDEFCERLN